MSRYATIQIKQDLSLLKNLFSKHLREKERKKIRALISLKQSEFKTRQELADSLEICLRTLERWLKLYTQEGIKKYLALPTRNKPSNVITEVIHQALSKKLSDSKNPLQGYTDAQRWLSQEFGVQIKYNNLRYYIHTHFKAKLKVARKSHLEKDPKAIAAFLKTT